MKMITEYGAVRKQIHTGSSPSVVFAGALEARLQYCFCFEFLHVHNTRQKYRNECCSSRTAYFTFLHRSLVGILCVYFSMSNQIVNCHGNEPYKHFCVMKETDYHDD